MPTRRTRWIDGSPTGQPATYSAINPSLVISSRTSTTPGIPATSNVAAAKVNAVAQVANAVPTVREADQQAADVFRLWQARHGSRPIRIVDLDSSIKAAVAPMALSQFPSRLWTEDWSPVTLDGEVFSPGGEVISRAFLRDPAHIDDADPLAGAVSIIVGENPVVSVPEASTTSLFVVALPALLVLLRRRGWSVSRGNMSRVTQALQ
jgi:hypothetical protein